MSDIHPEITTLKDVARRVRAHVIRVVREVGGGHIGGPLSAADLLAALYFHQLRIRPEQPDWPERDRFILSKGHCALALYATLAERGYLPVSELSRFGALGSRLQAHPDMTKAPGIDFSTGSLGQGLSAGVGMALAARLRQAAYHTYVMLGDGEALEGQVWEAAIFAGARKLANLTAIIDYNKLSQTGPTAPLHGLLAERWRAFGWEVREIGGHDLTAILPALQPGSDRPVAVVAHTVKGRGVSFMEGRSEWHSGSLTAEQAAAALAELGVSE
ncbi:MAG: transketolase [Bacillota bacterium]